MFRLSVTGQPPYPAQGGLRPDASGEPRSPLGCRYAALPSFVASGTSIIRPVATS